MSHLLFGQQRLRHFDDIATLLRSLLHLPGQQEAGSGHHPAVELPETLDHVEPMEEHHPSCRGLIAAGQDTVKGKFTNAILSTIGLHVFFYRAIQVSNNIP